MARLMLRVPKPKSFLYLMSLRTGTNLIFLTLLINKLSGLYGILALFTGLHLSSLQLSMYLYSIAALVLGVILFPHIQRQSPLQCLALACFYLLDTIINTAYTAAFGFAWFLVLAQHTSPSTGGVGKSGAADTIDDTAGFTDPEFKGVTGVDIVPLPTDVTSVGNNAQLVGHTGSGSVAPIINTLGSTLLQSGSIASIIVISALWLLRLYFILIVMAYARGVLRRHIVQSAHAMGQPLGSSSTGVEGGKYAEDPFAEGKELGGGWRGWLGRRMVGFGRGYWLGGDEDGEWNSAGAKSAKSDAMGNGAPPTLERERRRRAGTGPPLLRPIELGSLRKT